MGRVPWCSRISPDTRQVRLPDKRTEELTIFLATDLAWNHVCLGKLELDRGGMGEFKKETTWLTELTDLLFNNDYTNGERKKEFLGSEIDRLVNRIKRVFGDNS